MLFIAILLFQKSLQNFLITLFYNENNINNLKQFFKYYNKYYSIFSIIIV